MKDAVAYCDSNPKCDGVEDHYCNGGDYYAHAGIRGRTLLLETTKYEVYKGRTCSWVMSLYAYISINIKWCVVAYVYSIWIINQILYTYFVGQALRCYWITDYFDNCDNDVNKCFILIKSCNAHECYRLLSFI